MNSFLTFFSNASISAFGWTLVHSLWQGTLLSVTAAVLFHLFRNKSAALRYNVGISILAAQILASLITFAWYRGAASAQLHDGPAAGLQAFNNGSSLDRIEYQLSMSSKVQLWFYMHLNELVICWLIGAGVLMLRFIGGWVYTEILRSESKAVSNKEWRTRFGLLTARLNISREIELRETARVLTPMVIGIVKPVVLLPIGLLSGFSISQIEAILAHELAHVRRGDFLVNMLQSLAEVVYFFHPGLWWLSEKIRNERENCCDDIAVSVCGDRVSLANALVKVAEWQNAPALAMAFASKKPVLLQRVRRVLGLTPKPVKTFAPMPFLAITLSLLVGVSLYAVGQQDEKKSTAKPTKKPAGEIIKISADTLILHAPVAEKLQLSEPKEEVEVNLPLEIRADTTGPHSISVDGKTITLFSGAREKVVFSREKLFFPEVLHLSDEDTEKIRMQIEELRLQHEKLSFDAERAQRQTEKLEWKKQAAADVRYKLMEKRSALLNPPKTGTAPSADIEKQLTEFEEQIKMQEEIITKLNMELMESRKEVYKAEEPMRIIEKNIDELSRKIDHSFAAVSIKPHKLANTFKTPYPAKPAKPIAPAKFPMKYAKPAKKLPPPPPVEAPPPPPVPAKK